MLAVTVVLLWTGALSIIDIRFRRLPNELTLGGAVVIVTGAAVAGHGAPAAAGASALAGLYLVVHLWSPAAMGAAIKNAVRNWLETEPSMWTSPPQSPLASTTRGG